jgi:hypothetical protein
MTKHLIRTAQETPVAPCCPAQHTDNFPLAPYRSPDHYSSHCCLLTLELNRRQDEKRAEKRNEKAEEVKRNKQ